ncbi:CAAX amino terminal protease family protein [Abeliophyllum distichum]|uniref:CAAX amino terminal protease family protein n=1 Tax=Abeliophyllum distichum TaxID=126358 RepID=A0ABD1PSZ8_9LAMI
MTVTTILIRPPICLNPSKFNGGFSKPSLKSTFFSSRASFQCRCIKHEGTPKGPESEGFSVLESDTPCDFGSIWSSMGFYVFSIHVPLSFGGLSLAAKVLHQTVLDPQIQAFLILVIQTMELSIVLLLFKCPGKPHHSLLDFFHVNKASEERSWLLGSLLGFGLLVSLVFITSIVADRLIGPKDVNNPFLKEILLTGSSSTMACILVYCIVTPLLEEVVYRGFLLTSLASTMKWHQSVAISSLVFSAAHFSCENFLQLFIIGFVLGCTYCWTGNLSSSILTHSLYNALTLFLTFIS